jgi:hypothetical protein
VAGIARPLTVADGELIPTLKARRRAITNDACLIDEMFR